MRLAKRFPGAFSIALATLSIAWAAGCASKAKQARGGGFARPVSAAEVERLESAGAGVSSSVPESTGLDKMSPEEIEGLADTHFRSGNLHLALVEYEKAIRSNAGKPRLRYKKGLLYVAGKAYEDAVVEFRKVIQQEPQNALAYEGLGLATFHLKRYEQARSAFEKALSLNPNLSKSYAFLGILYDYQGLHREAAEEYRRALALEPDNGLLYNNLGVAYYLSGDYPRALTAFHAALNSGLPGKRGYNNLGMVLCRIGRYDEALEVFREGGDEAQAYNNLGCMYLQQGEVPRAVLAFEKAIALRPGFYELADKNLRRCKLALRARAAAGEESPAGPTAASPERPAVPGD